MSPSPFHPDLRSIARILPRGVAGPRVLRVIRRLEPLSRRPPPKGVTDEVVGDISVRVYGAASTDAPRAALLWIHGGGFVFGHPGQEDRFCLRVARDLDVIVASVDHRLAPEHPFPTPTDDCHDALVWLAGRSDVDADRIAIGGASAGGGLAASLALLARERAEVSPAFQLLRYPMLDDRTVGRTHVNEPNFRLWNSRSNRFGWESYLATEPGGPGVSPIAAPARHDDLSGLPPAWIGVGTLDLFHDEDLAYADRLEAAGVSCERVVVEGAFHGFDAIRKSGVAQGFEAAQIEALKRGLSIA